MIWSRCRPETQNITKSQRHFTKAAKQCHYVLTSINPFLLIMSCLVFQYYLFNIKFVTTKGKWRTTMKWAYTNTIIYKYFIGHLYLKLPLKYNPLRTIRTNHLSWRKKLNYLWQNIIKPVHNLYLYSIFSLILQISKFYYQLQKCTHIMISLVARVEQIESGISPKMLPHINII